MNTRQKIVKQIIECFKKGNKILIFGCGGSLAMASHFAAEFIGKGLPAIALNDPTVISALANDHSFNKVFSWQIWVLGKKGDVGIALSTSGKSKSVLEGIRKAKKLGLNVIDFPRNIEKKDDRDVAKIQEFQMTLLHKVYLAVDEYFSKIRL